MTVSDGPDGTAGRLRYIAGAALNLSAHPAQQK